MKRIITMFFSHFRTLVLAGLFSVSSAYAEPPLEDLYAGLGSELLPELAAPGEHSVGVKTISLVNSGQLSFATGKMEDRKLTVELWYPAKKGTGSLASYQDVTRSHKPFRIQGTAFRQAKHLKKKQYPLVVLSHGYTGYRSLMFYLAEHLASHGYVVAAIDHTDSTNAEVKFSENPFSGFPSTLYYRSRDQQFVLNELMRDKKYAKYILPDAAGLVGYSMGGYGGVNTLGGCYKFPEQLIGRFTGTQDPQKIKENQKLFNSCAGGQYDKIQVDPRWKAAILLAPWGGQLGIFDPEALKKVSTPTLFIAGDEDDISGYAGIQSLYEGFGSEHRYLLTYLNARHNIAAHPAPAVSRATELDIGHYWEAAWGIEQVNIINKHFALAMMDCHIKKNTDQCAFLALRPLSNQKFVDGKLTDPWKGFPHRYSTGMTWSQKDK